MSDTNNYIENLLLNLGSLKSDLNDTEPTMGTLSDSQREALVSLLGGLEYSLTAYGESDYGCCQDICEAEICFDAPSGYNTPELLEKVSFLINMSNLGVANIPSNARFKEWYGSIDNNMSRALVGEYVLPIVDWIFENVLRLEKPTNDNTQVLTYSLVAGLLYVVFGDPVLMLKASEGFLAEDSVDGMLDSLVKDVFNLDHDNWKEFLASLNETLTKELTGSQADDITITEDNVYELVSWILSNLQDSLNQSEDKDDCSSEFGVKFPSYPGVLWVLVNTLLAVVGSFLISGARGKFGKKANGDLNWVPSFGLKDTDNSDFSHLFGDTRSPFSGFSVKNVYVENGGLGPIIVQFNEEVTNAEFDYNHASLGDIGSYDVSLKRLDPESVTICNISVFAHPSEHDKVQLIIDNANPVLFDGEYGQDYVLKIKIGADGMSDIYNDDGDVDKAPAWTQNWASDGARREISLEGDSCGPTFSDFMRWAMDNGAGTFTDCINYLIDWHSRNLQPEFNDAYVALQSIGWMNRKGSDFAGFLHPDSMCGPYIEQLFADYFNTMEEECVKVKIESSCGVFKCDNLKWSATCPDGDSSIVTMLSRSTIGTNDAQEAGFLFAKTEEIVSHNPEGGVSLCVIDCAECGSQNCPPEMIEGLEELITLTDEAIAALEVNIATQIEIIEAGMLQKQSKESELGDLVMQHESDYAQYQADRTKLQQDFDDNFCGTQDATNACAGIEADIAQLDAGWAAAVGQFDQQRLDLEAEISDIVEQIVAASQLLEQHESEKEAAEAEKERLIAQLEDCDCEDCTNGPWKIIRQGTDASEYSAECLIGWDYTDEGDIVVDESKPAYGAKTISLGSKPNTLLVDKSGDIYADGNKVARIALCALTNTSFTSLFDPDLPLLMIHPKYIGDKRIFHVMQEKITIVEDYPNSLRDELKRHEILPYPIGRFFQGDPCDDSEPEECLEEWCCRNPDLPDCLDIGECGGVTIPQWFRDWYEEHRDYLILKLPYDKRYIGDPIRYSYDEQILFAKALIDLVVRYFNSTPMVVANGFSDWSDMTRQLNVLPLLLKDRPTRTKFRFADWMVGKNSNSPEINYPATDEVCVECCDDILNSDCDILDTFEDCCESSCGRWNRDCSYLTGDIVTGLSGEHCYEASVDICAGECNPEPGTPGSEGIWFRCTPDCETEIPPCDFTVSDQYVCEHEGCDARVAVALQYNTPETPNLCDYRWIFTARNVNLVDFPPISVESFGKNPTDPWSEINLPILPVNCDDSENLGYYVGIDDTHLVSAESLNPNVWTFTLQARSSISDEILSECTSDSVSFDIGCDFNVAVWDDLEAAKANGEGWCDEQGGDNPNGKRQAAPASELGDSIESLNQSLEDIYAWRDFNDIASLSQQTFDALISDCNTVLNNLMSAQEMPDDFDYANLQEEINTAINTFVINDANAIGSSLAACSSFRKSVLDIIYAFGVYAGATECCCVVLTPSSEENVCEMSWVWTVDTGVGAPIPYYGGKGKLPLETVACAIRNPNQEGFTVVNAKVYSYASTCDDYVRSAIENWSGQQWTEYFDPISICSCEDEIVIACPCEPRGGIVDLEFVGCDEQDDTKFIANLTHSNELNECIVDWKWQIQPLNSSVIDISGGQGYTATPIFEQILEAGTEYTIVLVWQSLQNSSVSGNVFSQTFTTPYCPKLDLTHNFDGNRFSDTAYGDITLEDYTESGVVAENNGSSVSHNFNMTIVNANSKGSAHISAQHTPNEQDQQWLAVDDTKYTFKWIVEVVDEYGSPVGNFFVPQGELIKTTGTSGYPIKGKVPDLNTQIPEHLMGYNYYYSVTLEAVPKDDSVSGGDFKVGPFINSKHKGQRYVSISRTGTPHPGVERLEVMSGGEGIFVPTVDFDGTVSEELTINSTYENGYSGSSDTATVTFSVTNDQCGFTSNSFTELIAASGDVIDTQGNGKGRVFYNGTAEFSLNDECDLLNSANPHQVSFSVMVEGDESAGDASWETLSTSNVSEDGMLNKITVDFEDVEVMWNHLSDVNQTKAKVKIKCEIEATDNPVPGATTTVASSTIAKTIYSPYQPCLKNPETSDDGQYPRWYVWDDRDANGDGEPDACPCYSPQLKDDPSGRGISWKSGFIYEYAPSAPSPYGTTKTISLDQFLEDSGMAIEVSANLPPQVPAGFSLAPPNQNNNVTISTMSDDSAPKAGDVANIRVTYDVYDPAKFSGKNALDKAKSEGCSTTFVVVFQMTVGCKDSSQIDYVKDANISSSILDCRVKVLGCTDGTAYNYNPDANVDDGTCVPVIEGCMDPNASNYDVSANTDNKSCTYDGPSLKASADTIVDANISNGSGAATVSKGTDSIIVSLNANVFGHQDYAAANIINLRDLINFSGAVGNSGDYEISWKRRDLTVDPTVGDNVSLTYGVDKKQKLGTIFSSTEETNRDKLTYNISKPTLYWDVTVEHTNNEYAAAGANYSFTLQSDVAKQIIYCYEPTVNMEEADLLSIARDRVSEDSNETDDTKVSVSVSGNTGTIEFESGFFKDLSQRSGYEHLEIDLNDLFGNPWSSLPHTLINSNKVYTWSVEFYDANDTLISITDKDDSKQGSSLISGGEGTWKSANEISSSEVGAINNIVHVALDGNLNDSHAGLALFDEKRLMPESKCGYPAMVKKAIITATARYASSRCDGSNNPESSQLTIIVHMRDHTVESANCCFDVDEFRHNSLEGSGVKLNGYKDWSTGKSGATDLWSHLFFEDPVLLESVNKQNTPGYGKFDCSSVVGVAQYGAYEENVNPPAGAKSFDALEHLIFNSEGLMSVTPLPEEDIVQGKPELGIFPAVPAGSDVSEEIARLLVEMAQNAITLTDCGTLETVLSGYARRLYTVGQLRVVMCGRSQVHFANLLNTPGIGFSVSEKEELTRIIQTGVDSKGQQYTWAQVLGISNWLLSNILKWLTGSVVEACGACNTDSGISESPTKALLSSGTSGDTTKTATIGGGKTVEIEVHDWSSLAL